MKAWYEEYKKLNVERKEAKALQGKFRQTRIICKTQEMSMMQKIQKLLEVSCYAA